MYVNIPFSHITGSEPTSHNDMTGQERGKDIEVVHYLYTHRRDLQKYFQIHHIPLFSDWVLRSWFYTFEEVMHKCLVWMRSNDYVMACFHLPKMAARSLWWSCMMCFRVEPSLLLNLDGGFQTHTSTLKVRIVEFSNSSKILTTFY